MIFGFFWFFKFSLYRLYCLLYFILPYYLLCLCSFESGVRFINFFIWNLESETQSGIRMASPKRPRREEPPVGLVNCMKQKLTSGKFSDVRFAVGRHYSPVKIFEAHKIVLAIRSSVFSAMFYGSLPENCAVPIDIPDCIPDAFANVLSYMYTDGVENLNADNVFEIMNCADKYDLASLVRICLEKILSELDVENCLTVLEQLAQWQVNADTIREACLHLLDEKTEEVLRSEHFISIRQDTLRTILQRSTLSAKKIVIFLAVESWSAEACKRNNMVPSAVNRRQMLGDAFPLALGRFPKLAKLPDGPGPIRVGDGLMTIWDFITVSSWPLRNRRVCEYRITAEVANGQQLTIWPR
ncbi:BTB/POZ domain-containing protein 6-B-like isoform X2 [Paramacrobiotus metropolitanus]|uniref:BTB/POZ domain-containing protein 6-B-like isoform X2 n=1 Tax=Paramacrobiotus metropolitanus TaxID=2943436 RepID=UPI002445B450|nr:BTB/POZ domain-containing protein 6-B-like isoform X2 [Paramacrobiotus metropolitanus]